MAKTAYHKIRGDKAMKKRIAEFLASYDINYTHINVRELLTHGHRGYLAMSEEDLYVLADKRYKILADNEAFEKLPQMAATSSYSRKEIIKSTREKMLLEAKSVFDEIFEKTCLV